MFGHYLLGLLTNLVLSLSDGFLSSFLLDHHFSRLPFQDRLDHWFCQEIVHTFLVQLVLVVALLFIKLDSFLDKDMCTVYSAISSKTNSFDNVSF